MSPQVAERSSRQLPWFPPPAFPLHRRWTSADRRPARRLFVSGRSPLLALPLAPQHTVGGDAAPAARAPPAAPLIVVANTTDKGFVGDVCQASGVAFAGLHK